MLKIRSKQFYEQFFLRAKLFFILLTGGCWLCLSLDTVKGTIVGSINVQLNR